MFGKPPRLVVGALVIALPLIALARSGHGGACDREVPDDPAQVKAFVQPFLDGALTNIDARPDQRAAITDAVEASIDDMMDVRRDGHELRGRFRDALARNAPPTELEALRQEAMQLVDSGSRVAVERMSAVRGQLTDEQWAKLQEMHDARSGWGHRW